MPEANKSPQEMHDRVHEVVAVIGCLMACYPEGSRTGRELEQYRKGIMGLVYGDLTDTLGKEDRENSELISKVQGNKDQMRIVRALNRIDQDDKLAELVRNSQVLRELAGSGG